MRRILSSICAVFIIVSALCGAAWAEHAPYTILKDQAVGAFPPMKGTVMAVEGKTLQSSLGQDSGLRPGMRLTVLRPGESFVHPITSERVGQAEEPAGTAEAVEVTEESSQLTLVSGEAHAGDIVRLSSAPIPLLFFQSADVEWGIAEEYFNTLKESGRFILIETAPGEPVDGAVLAEAKRLGADAALILTVSGPLNRTVLKQRILWADNSSEILSGEVLLSETEVEKSRLGDEYFSPDPNKPALELNLPHTAILMAAGDFDGDGAQEVAFSSGSTVRAYSISATLTPALNEAAITESLSETHLWLQAADLTGDGADELLVSATDGLNARSYLYTYRDDEFQTIWNDRIFARVIGGKLYGQKSDMDGGFSGGVFPVKWGEITPDTDDLNLPEGINIYDFVFTAFPDGTAAVLAFDPRRHVSLYRYDTGMRLWRSDDDYGWPNRMFGERVMSDMGDREPWGVSDRMLNIGSGVTAIKRKKQSENMPGLGNSGADLVALYPEGKKVEETTMIYDLKGGTSDLAVMDQQLLVLVNTKGIDLGKLVMGRGLFSTKLYIYSLRSE